MIISKIPESDHDQVIQGGFKCLKLIISNYIDKLTQENFLTILQAIYRYASYDGDNINNNLTAIGMLQNISDFTSKWSLKENQEDQNILNPQRIW